MQPVNQHTPDANVEARYRVLLIIWFAMLTSIGMFFFLTTFIPRPQAAENDVLRFGLIATVLIMTSLSFVLKQRLLQQAVQKQQPQLVNTAYIIAFALTEVIALTGLLRYMLTPNSSYSLSFIVAVIIMILHFPRRKHVEAAAIKIR